MSSPLKGFDHNDSGLHLEAERSKLQHLIAFHQLCGNDLYVAAYNAWAELNLRYFNNALNCPLIEIGITPYGKCGGYYSPAQNPGRIMLHQSMGIHSRAVLQHEMGHQWQHQIGNAIYPAKGGKGGRPDWHHCSHGQPSALTPMPSIAQPVAATSGRSRPPAGMKANPSSTGTTSPLMASPSSQKTPI